MSVIDDRYDQLGGPAGFLGGIVSEEDVAVEAKARVRIYERGAIYWWVVDHTAGFGLSTQTYEVHGSIWQLYQALGRETGFLGLPLTDETGCADGKGRFNGFEGGSIYWTFETRAHEVHGEILAKWSSLDAERGALGYPLTDETECPDGVGRFHHFQNGSIYKHPEAGVNEVHGPIHQKWSELGWERGLLGYPITDQMADSFITGSFNDFQGGSVYWTAQTGAHEVHGAIREKWRALGAERSNLGRPVSDEEYWIDEATNTSGQRNFFEHGVIECTPAWGAVPWPNQYVFTLSGMMVMNTRSRHEDTDRVSMSVAVGNKPTGWEQTVTKDLGDVNNGNYDIGLRVGPVPVDGPGIGVAFNYVMLNAGKASWDEVNKKLNEAGSTLAQAGAKAATEAIGAAVGAAIGTAVMPVIGSAIGAVAGWIAGELTGLLTADCDGPVAVEQAAFKGQELWNHTAQGPHTFSTIHDGVDSPAGCGSNSIYWVDWTVERA